MKIAVLADIFGTVLPASFAVAQPAVGKVGLAAVLNGSYAGSKANLTSEAEKMPEADYGVKPGTMPEVRTFGQFDRRGVIRTGSMVRGPRTPARMTSAASISLRICRRDSMVVSMLPGHFDRSPGRCASSSRAACRHDDQTTHQVGGL
jgi:hypothetical protein